MCHRYAFGCRHATSDASDAATAKPFGRRQGYAQPATVAVPPEPFHHPVVETPAVSASAGVRAVTDADAEPPVTRTVCGRRPLPTAFFDVVDARHAAAGPEQHVERGRRQKLVVQTAAATVGRHFLPTGGRYHQPVRSDGAQSPERLETRFADRHQDTGARPKDLIVYRCRRRLRRPRC